MRLGFRNNDMTDVAANTDAARHETDDDGDLTDSTSDANDQADGGVALTNADIERLTSERDDFLDQLQRSRADFANFRRRVEQERSMLREVASQSLLVQFLPVLDDLQRALAAVPDDQRNDPLVQGVQLIERKFWSAFERAGVRPIEADGATFDPAIHEAVDTEPGSSADTVTSVYQTGYRLGTGLLRPALVKVGGSTKHA